jgi:hypothetical protein
MTAIRSKPAFDVGANSGDGPGISELCRLLAELGYHCVALGPEFEDPRTGELLQANGVFVKRH